MPDTLSPRRPRLWPAARLCLVSGGLTLLILAVVYALRGIWPFGGGSVAYVDTTQFYLPDYYALWDAAHGAVPDPAWLPGLAEGSGISLWSWLSPPNLVLLLLPRDRILEGLSLYLAVFLLEIAVTTSAAVALRFPRLRLGPQTALVLCYVFSGYTLQYYSNFSWLWVAAVFPLLLLGLERLLREGKYGLYAVVFAYFLFNSVYFSYMATVFVILFAAGYCLFLLPRELRGDRLLRLGGSTAAAFGLTAYWWMWTSTAMTNTSRFRSNLDAGLMTGLTTWNIQNTRHTVLMLLELALAFALLFRALRRQGGLAEAERAKRRGAIRFFAWMLGLLAIPMVFTNIDAAWHFGQYNFFPMRYGFMLPALVLAAAGLSLEEEQALPPAKSPSPGLYLLLLLPAAGLILLEPGLSRYLRAYGAVFLNTLNPAEYWGSYFPRLAGCGILFLVLYLMLLRLPRRTAAPLLAVALLLQLGTNTYSLIAPDDDHIYTREYDPAYVDAADALHTYFSGQDKSPLARVKNVDNSLNAGYPVIAGVSALSSVNSGNSALRLGVFRELGYSVNYYRLLDTGGTVFSDMLLGVDTILSVRPLDGTLYADTGTKIAGVRVGSARYPGTIGLTFREGALEDYLDITSLPERLNALYEAFTGDGGAVAAAPDLTLDAAGEGLRTVTLTCELPGECFLYMAAENAVLINITAGGQTIPVPSYRNTDNTVYPAAFNANLLYLGVFGPGEAAVTFQSAADVSPEDVTLLALDKGRVERFADDALGPVRPEVRWDGSTLTLTLRTEEAGRRLFLPMTFSARWRCEVNGRPVETARTLGALMSLPLDAGDNTVTVTRTGSSLAPGTGGVISLASLALVLLWTLFLRRRCPAASPRLEKAACYAFIAVSAAALLLFYAAPAALFLLRGSVIPF